MAKVDDVLRESMRVSIDLLVQAGNMQLEHLRGLHVRLEKIEKHLKIGEDDGTERTD